MPAGQHAISLGLCGYPHNLNPPQKLTEWSIGIMACWSIGLGGMRSVFYVWNPMNFRHQKHNKYYFDL
jgi:hypothetical protein